MKSAHNSVVQTESSTLVKRDRLDSESVIHSNELLQQLSELVDGLVNLSAPFKYSSVGCVETDEWTPLKYTDKLMTVTGSDSVPSHASESR
jgi:hypothetical protein